MPDVLPGQRFGGVLLGLYVCHVLIIIEGPLCFLRRGAFVCLAKIPGVERSTFLSLVHREGHFSTRSDPRMRGNVAGLAGGDGQVYDVTT